MQVQSCCFTYKTNCFFKSSLSLSWLLKLPSWSVIGCDPVIHCFPRLCSGLGAICMPLKSHLGLPKLTFRLSIAKQTSHLIFQGNYDSCISPQRAEGRLGNIRHTGEFYKRKGIQPVLTFAKTSQLSLIFQTCFDGTSVIFSVTYFEIAVEFKARAILQSSLHCVVNIAY